ncbi:hypothetical protein TOT_030000820 [Theileria orientalis strain Shintoku]|uniref:Uncharacterized protein n=1 Tax=Theileria orientalis strain Shintoku TaxID=869250 RepID=J4CDQ6_THEOR|nr:hypothetical protein TOT_030000820 [Theileria orientalis strain Shintoku]BAM41557.1 hypothetical protein TOT_030000820 [Theileria orientalis strain Shintoku]|eukprot:XP_009691858.1 hypothetical protein TOT_030000820 [Theileria orientalis strain Shintoku]
MHTTSQKKASKNLKKFKVKGNVTTTAHGQITINEESGLEQVGSSTTIDSMQ